jgi:outer membrane protein TolC
MYLIIIIALFFGGCVRSDYELNAIRTENAELDEEVMASLPALKSHVLTLNDILERVLSQNLDLFVKAKEYEYQYELTTGAQLKMIPPLVFEGEASDRNRNTGSSSESLVPGVPPAPPSISSEQHVNRYDITFTWNLLDFGVSYFRARQEANKTSIKEMEYLRVRQKLIQDTVKNYWKARATLLGITKFGPIVIENNKLLAFTREQIANQILPKDKALLHERQVLRQEIQIQLYEKEYHEAMSELGRLMSVSCEEFSLAQDELTPLEIELPMPCILGELALLNRPELYGLDMEERSVRDEAQIAFIEMFPSISPFIGSFFDSNRFLIFHRWIYGGIRYTWNLLSIPYHMQDFLSESLHRNIIQYERLALSIGILTQVNLAWIAYQDTLQEYKLVAQLADVNRDLLQAVELRQSVGETTYYDILIDYTYDAMFSEVEALRAYGDVKNAIELINSSIGIPFYLDDNGSDFND